jgi:predicted 3-demethylubiquinone-9 3-methyltransferase (glyoxalase superfamily)
MQNRFQRISPFLWFADQAEEAAQYYCSIFENSRITATTRYNDESAGPTGRAPGSVMTVAFELDGQQFAALNGGPLFKFNEALSLVVNCKSQDEVEHYWSALSRGGDANAQQCGWLKDKYGVSWQVVPVEMIELLKDVDGKRAARVMHALMKMKKIDLAEIRKAAA